MRRRRWFPTNAGSMTVATAYGDPVAEAGNRALYAAGGAMLDGSGRAGGNIRWRPCRVRGFLAPVARVAGVPGGGGRSVGPGARALPGTSGPVDTVDGTAARMRDVIRQAAGYGGLG